MSHFVTALKLPVPGPWQAVVLRAMTDLAIHTGLPSIAVAPTRVEEASWTTAGGITQGLEISLIAAGRSHRYRAEIGSSVVERLDSQD